MKKFLLLLLLIPFVFSKGNAQSSANYTFSTGTTGNFTTGIAAQSIDMSTGTTSLIGPGLTSIGSSLTQIGFDFFYMNTYNSSFTVATNGAIILNGTVTAGNNIAGGTGNRLGAFVAGTSGNDMGTHSSGKVHYKVFGTAPNRVCVIEFLNMSVNRFSGTADASFQVRLYETTGVIEYVYGSMNSNSALTAVRIGFSSNSTANTYNTVTISSNTNSTAAVVSNSVAIGQITNLHSPVEGSRRYYRFAPSIPLAPAALSANSTAAGSMTLNITASPTAGVLSYPIYQSTSLAGTYTYLGSLAAAGSATVSGLNAATTYYYKVYAASEGGLSTAATASGTTTAAGNITSAQSGNWNDVTTWVGGAIPTSGDNVTVANGHTVTINSAAYSKNLTVQGTLTYDATTTNVLTVFGNLSVATGASLLAYNVLSGREIDLYGNLTNSGTIDLSKASTFLLMLGNTPQTISGSGVFVGTDGTGTPANTGILRNLYNYNTSGITVSAPFIITSALNMYAGTVNATNLVFDNTQTSTGVTPPSAVTVTRIGTGQLAGTSSVGSTATYNLSYSVSGSYATVATTAGPEVPANGIVNNLTVANTAGVTFSSALQVKGTLTVQGIINMGANNLTLGSSVAAPGTLTYTYGLINTTGTVTRWFGTTAITQGASTGLFPIGVSNNYRSFWISGTPTTGGSLSVKFFTGAAGSTALGTPFTENAVNYNARSNFYWQVSTGNGLTGTGLALRMQGSNLPGVTTFADVNTSLVNGVAPGTFSAGTQANSDVQVNRSGLTEANLNNNFYFAVNSTANPLPVTIISFAGERNAKVNVLHWSTSTEIKNTGFEMERSADGKNYSSIGFTSSKADNGTSANTLNYSFTDQKPFTGSNYYRLKQVDKDGKFTYSSVVVLKGGKVFEISALYPNPAKEQLNVAVNAVKNEKASISIIDISGKVLKTISKTLIPGDNNISINVSGFATGRYFIRVVNEANEIKTTSFLKN
jgi:hypothetical protein